MYLRPKRTALSSQVDYFMFVPTLSHRLQPRQGNASSEYGTVSGSMDFPLQRMSSQFQVHQSPRHLIHSLVPCIDITMIDSRYCEQAKPNCLRRNTELPCPQPVIAQPRIARVSAFGGGYRPALPLLSHLPGNTKLVFGAECSQFKVVFRTNSRRSIVNLPPPGYFPSTDAYVVWRSSA
jgi:hypothetical protein